MEFNALLVDNNGKEVKRIEDAIDEFVIEKKEDCDWQVKVKVQVDYKEETYKPTESVDFKKTQKITKQDVFQYLAIDDSNGFALSIMSREEYLWIVQKVAIVKVARRCVRFFGEECVYRIKLKVEFLADASIKNKD